MKNNNLIILLFALLAIFMYSCLKEGHGGSSSIIVTVRHVEYDTTSQSMIDHLVRNCTVGLKYGSTKTSQLGDCDQVKMVDTIHAQTAFSNLLKGNYSLYAEGTDMLVNFGMGGVVVTGDTTVKISKNKEVLEVTLITRKKK